VGALDVLSCVEPPIEGQVRQLRYSRRPMTEASAPEGPPRSRPVVLVEMHAHYRAGHTPVVFAELATALLALGCRVEILTSHGWSLADDPELPNLDIRRLGPIAARIFDRAQRLRRDGTSRRSRRLGDLMRTTIVVLETNRLLRRTSFDDVIAFTQLDPLVTSLLARGGRWLTYQFAPPAPPRAGRRARLVGAIQRPLTALARRRARGRRGPRVRVVTNDAGAADAWTRTARWLRPVTLPFIGARPRKSIVGARQRLGLPEDVTVALLWGNHPAKDHELVWRAFERMPDHHLVIGGSNGAEAYAAWAEGRTHTGRTPTLQPGFADETTRALLYAASDLVIVSFRAGAPGDSGTLVDAIAWGSTVVCSEQCPSADIVRSYRLGTTFEPGNVESLIEAVRGAPATPDPAGLREAQEAFATSRLARRNLAALDELGAGSGHQHDDGLCGRAS